MAETGMSKIIRGDLAIELTTGEHYDLENNDAIETSVNGRAIITWPDHSVTRLSENTRIVIHHMYANTHYDKIEISMSLKKGKIWTRVVRTMIGDSYFETKLPKNDIVAARPWNHLRDQSRKKLYPGSHLNSELTLRWELALLKLKRDVENKVYTFEESYDSAEKMRLDFMNNGVVPTSKIVNIHVQLCGRISAAMQVIDIYMSENVECSIYAFNSAITLAGNIARASCYFMALRKQQLYSSIKLVAEQTTRNSTDENLDIIFETLFFFNVVPNIVTINVLLNIASNDTEIGKIFACGAKLRLAPLLITFNIMIARAESFNFALAYFRELKMYRYIPDIITLTGHSQSRP